MKVNQAFHYQVNETYGTKIIGAKTIGGAMIAAEKTHGLGTKEKKKDTLLVYLSYWMDDRKKDGCTTTLVAYRRQGNWILTSHSIDSHISTYGEHQHEYHRR